MKAFLLIGSLYGFLGVAAGAFGAHFLEKKLEPNFLKVFEVGVKYQMYHAAALLAVGILCFHVTNKWTHAGGWSMTAGVIVFSGSLYILSLSGVRGWGAVTPIGGLLLLIGWINVFIGILAHK